MNLNPQRRKLTMENLELLEQMLVVEHSAEARNKNAKITNMGWAQDDYAIVSKTNKGLLESIIDPNTLKVKHEWE